MTGWSIAASSLSQPRPVSGCQEAPGARGLPSVRRRPASFGSSDGGREAGAPRPRALPRAQEIAPGASHTPAEKV